MIGLFNRRQQHGIDTAALGAGAVALRLGAGATVPAGCSGLLYDGRGNMRRVAAGARAVLAGDEIACCFHPGPYSMDLVPFQSAPEMGLRTSLVVDTPDPRVAQQRFDLFLMAEAEGRLDTAALHGAIEAALQRELEQGNLALPPCTSLGEWNVFRAGFNQLLYTRFGLTVEDCVPVDLGDTVDYAQLLLARAAAPATPTPEPVAAAPATAAQQVREAPLCDARALRRLFLELPGVMCSLRLAVLPPGQALFRQHQALLRRLDGVSLAVATMPALELAAPGQPLASEQQLRRMRHSARAVAALDEAWALLARLKVAAPAQLASLFDEADRIISNLEHDSAGRRLASAEGGQP